MSLLLHCWLSEQCLLWLRYQIEFTDCVYGEGLLEANE